MATVSHSPDSQPPDSLQAQVANLSQRLDYVVSVLDAMCREAGTEHLMAAGGPIPPLPARRLRAV